MEREALLFTVAAALYGIVVSIAALSLARSSRRFGEVVPAAWWRLVAPLFMGVLMFAFFCGWALQEPDPADERPKAVFYVLAAVTVCIVLRAAVRSLKSLCLRVTVQVPVCTVGFVRPRIVVSDEFRRIVSSNVLAAALAHERAHARRRDPLRIWLAQLAADLQWPAPGAARRVSAWLLAIESECDDEALSDGVAGEDLAEAILTAARLHRSLEASVVAHAYGGGTDIAWRVRRLLSHSASTSAPQVTAPWAATAWCITFTAAAVWLGFHYGDSVLRALPGMAP